MLLNGLSRTPCRRSSPGSPIPPVLSAQEPPCGRHTYSVLLGSGGSLNNTRRQLLSAGDAHKCWTAAMPNFRELWTPEVHLPRIPLLGTRVNRDRKGPGLPYPFDASS